MAPPPASSPNLYNSLLAAALHPLACHLDLRHLCLISDLPAEKYSLVFSEANSLKSRSLSGKFTNVVSLLVRILDSENRFRSGVNVGQGRTGQQELHQSIGGWILRGRLHFSGSRRAGNRGKSPASYLPTLLTFTPPAPCHQPL